MFVYLYGYVIRSTRCILRDNESTTKTRKPARPLYFYTKYLLQEMK